MTLDEIATETGLTRGCVHMTIQRALQKLRRKGLVLEMKALADELDANRRAMVE